MRRGGRILAIILQKLSEKVAPGIATKELEAYARQMIAQYHVKPSFLGYKGYPAVLCTNVNEEVVHTIPGEHVLKNGDIISIDCGVLYEGMHTDAAITVPVGTIALNVQKFIKTASHALESAIQIVKAGVYVREISGIIQDIVEGSGYSVVRELTGHGVGKKLHEDPPVPNSREHTLGSQLKPGMTIAIEPIITIGKRHVQTLADGWTVVTKDGSYAAQVEHTVLVTKNGCEILTK